ncbi:unnamed protein product [Brassicogethes aeneus]|uniref:Uncharacterized protein n=1 Tax=Brassicogethes aeneus TaxID=1431903 RepID=A0A9P0AWR6_BRAAE|nr:unnamed protein product [Brassicogethes aeneus]
MNSALSAVVFIIIVVCIFVLYTYFQCKIKRRETKLHYRYEVVPSMHDTDFLVFLPQRQQDEIYNISGRVQGQNSEQRLPSDAYLTVEHITASNQLNKPSYNDEPPSYEEAIKLASHLPPPPVLPPVYTGIYDRPSVHVTSPVSPTVTIAIS